MKTVPPKTLEDNGSFLKFTNCSRYRCNDDGPTLKHWEYLAITDSPPFPELLPGETRSLQTRPRLIGKFIGNAVGPHHPLLA
jgi:hypothetical protein